METPIDGPSINIRGGTRTGAVMVLLLLPDSELLMRNLHRFDGQEVRGGQLSRFGASGSSARLRREQPVCFGRRTLTHAQSEINTIWVALLKSNSFALKCLVAETVFAVCQDGERVPREWSVAWAGGTFGLHKCALLVCCV